MINKIKKYRHELGLVLLAALAGISLLQFMSL